MCEVLLFECVPYVEQRESSNARSFKRGLVLYLANIIFETDRRKLLPSPKTERRRRPQIVAHGIFPGIFEWIPIYSRIYQSSIMHVVDG